MSSAICIPCSQQFNSQEEFDLHKKSGHVTRGIPIVPPGAEPPPPEFLEAVERIESKKKEVITPDPVIAPPEAPQGSTDPIRLTYHFVGSCPEHNVPVETYEIDAGKQHFAIAVCPKDKKQLETKTVEKL